MDQVAQSEQEETHEQSLSAAQSAVDQFHSQLATDVNAHRPFAKLVKEHTMFNAHRAADATLQQYSLFFNSIFMAADLYGIDGDSIKECYSNLGPPTDEDIAVVEKLLTAVSMVNIHIGTFNAPSGSRVPAFFACMSFSEEIGYYDMILIPDLPDNPTASFRLKISQKAVQGVKMEVDNGKLDILELNPTPSGVLLMARAAFEATKIVQETRAKETTDG